MTCAWVLTWTVLLRKNTTCRNESKKRIEQGKLVIDRKNQWQVIFEWTKRNAPRWNALSDLFPITLSMASKTSKKFEFFPPLPSSDASTILRFRFLLFRWSWTFWTDFVLLFPRNTGSALDDFVSGISSVVGVIRCCRAVVGKIFVRLFGFDSFSDLSSSRTSSSAFTRREDRINVVSIAIISLIAAQSFERAATRTWWSKIHGGKREIMYRNVCDCISGNIPREYFLLNYEAKKEIKSRKEATAQWRRRKIVALLTSKTDFEHGKSERIDSTSFFSIHDSMKRPRDHTAKTLMRGYSLTTREWNGMNFRTKYFYAEILLFVLKHRSYFLVSYPSCCSRRCPIWGIVHSIDRFGIFRDKSRSPDTCVEITLLIRGIAAATVFTQNLGWISYHKSECVRITSAILQ